ncbi:MAG: hypothetical protein K2Q10_05460, partial [Rhodospirillales bacterium]|nr:hypothetical protein [Rhodospirillales bacterium]
MAVRLWPFALALFLSACAYRSGFVDNPINRKASWFSYVDGADLRAACKPGTPDRTRLIYNADYQIQVRSYDLGESEPGHLVSRVSGSGNLTAGLSLNDPLGPWRGAKAETVLTAEQMRQLEAAFQAS